MDNKKKNRSPLKNPLLIFLVISIIATVILNMVMLSLQTPKKQEISYSEFLTMLDENKVDEVILQSEQIVIYEKYDESQPITTPKTTEFMKMMGIDTDAVIEQAKENSRNVYYTGITRAKAKVYLVGSKADLAIAIGNNDIGKRNTMLAACLRSEAQLRGYEPAKLAA